MSCCAPGTEMALEAEQAREAGPRAEELVLASRSVGDGLKQTDLSVPGVHCGACIQTIESALGRLDGVAGARVNLSTKRVSVNWREGALPPIIDTLNRLGYAAHLFDSVETGRDQVLSQLIRAVAISGFAAGNIMLLSVSVWSGAEQATRDLFHWLSALIALPALMFAGGIFYRSALNALRHGRMNMDVPIALGISLAYGLSLYETVNSGQHATLRGGKHKDTIINNGDFADIHGGKGRDQILNDADHAKVRGGKGRDRIASIGVGNDTKLGFWDSGFKVDTALQDECQHLLRSHRRC